MSDSKYTLQKIDYLPDWRHPKLRNQTHYWATRITYQCMKVLARLPFNFQLRIGRTLGRAGYFCVAGLRKKINYNLSECFPDLDPGVISSYTKAQFRSLGMSVFEMAYAWFASDARLRRRFTMTGIENLHAAHAKNRGVILVSAHFTTMEIAGVMLHYHVPDIQAVYRPFKELPLTNEIIKAGRHRTAKKLIERDDVSGIVRSLRNNNILWYASDQLVRAGKPSVNVRFFERDQNVHSGISDLARITGAAVVPFMPYRTANGQYQLNILPALNIPSGSRTDDMAQIMKTIEAAVLKDPSQYMWTKKRI